MTSHIKRLFFASVVSSLLLSSFAWGASARPTESPSGSQATPSMVWRVYDYLASFVRSAQPPAATAATDDKAVVETKQATVDTKSSTVASSEVKSGQVVEVKSGEAAVERYIMQLPGLSQHDDPVMYKESDLCGYYTVFFITKMLRAATENNPSLLNLLTDRGNFNEFFKGQTFRSNIEDKDIKAILEKNWVPNVCFVAMDERGAFYPSVLRDLEALDLKKPIGLAINLVNHWIAGMVTTTDAGVVLRVVDSLGKDCTKLPLVQAIGDYFVKKEQDMKHAVVDVNVAAAAVRLVKDEMKKAAEKVESQRIAMQQKEAEDAKQAQEVAAKADVEEARINREAQRIADEKFVQDMLKQEAGTAQAISSSSAASTSSARSEKTSSPSTIANDAKIAKALEDEAKSAALIQKLQQEDADAQAARQLQQQEAQVEQKRKQEQAEQAKRDAELAKQLSEQ